MIVDFDGTLAVLDVDWSSLRSALGVGAIGELWSGPAWMWGTVGEAEVAAARVASAGPALPLVEADGGTFAILTANGEASVRTWLARHPALAARCVAVVGRETLGGPKHDPERFEAGVHRCIAALGDRPFVYVSDADWELDLAAAHGAQVVAVAP